MIINLTQHTSTQDQRLAGVIDLPQEERTKLVDLLTVPEEELVAKEGLFESLMLSRVAGIISLIWPRLVEADTARVRAAARLYGEGETFGGWNAAREPLFQAMVGGAPYLVDRLVARLKELDVEPLYATSARRSIEETLADGSVKKTQVFAHLGFRNA
jgi:hypothetical protein